MNVSSRPPPVSRRFVSLGTKLAVAMTAVLVVISMLLFVELTGRERRTLVTAKRTAATMVSNLFAATISAPLYFRDADSINSELENLKSNPDIAAAAVWYWDAAQPAAEFRKEISELPAPTRRGEGDRVDVFADRVEVLRRVVGLSGQPVGMCAVVFSLQTENQAYNESRKRIFWLSFALAGGTAIILLAIARGQIVLPLAELADAARRLGHGEGKVHVKVGSRDEIGQLAEAFNLMEGEISDREQRLEAARAHLRDLFDHMRQAILAFGPDGHVEGEVSRQATEIFGNEGLAGKSVYVLLFGNVPGYDVEALAFKEWLDMAFDVSFSQWDAFAALAPREITLSAQDFFPIQLELEFRPVAKGERIERIMLLATDVSEKRRLEQSMHSQEELYARKLSAMQHMLERGSQAFVVFLDVARERMARCKEIVGTEPHSLLMGEIEELFRHVHTIKGEARAFDLRELEAEAGQLEELLDELRVQARVPSAMANMSCSMQGFLLTGFRNVEEGLTKGADVFAAASPIGKTVLNQVTVQRNDLTELMDLVGNRSDALGRVVARLAARPFGEATAGLVDRVPTWADAEGKRVQLEVDGREVLVPPALARVLGGVLTHLVRNGIAHGVERPEEREIQDKPPTGVIRITAVEGAQGLEITVMDDGGGLARARLMEAARALGVEEGEGTREHPEELAFMQGVSTWAEAGALAGRGVGLSAVRAELRAVGYSVKIESKEGQYTRVLLYPDTASNQQERAGAPTSIKSSERKVYS